MKKNLFFLLLSVLTVIGIEWLLSEGRPSENALLVAISGTFLIWIVVLLRSKRGNPKST